MWLLLNFSAKIICRNLWFTWTLHLLRLNLLIHIRLICTTVCWTGFLFCRNCSTKTKNSSIHLNNSTWRRSACGEETAPAPWKVWSTIWSLWQFTSLLKAIKCYSTWKRTKNYRSICCFSMLWMISELKDSSKQGYKKWKCFRLRKLKRSVIMLICSF